MNKDQELIWRYLSGDLSLPEKEAFEAALARDEQLREALIQERELATFLKNKDAKSAALQNLSDIHQEVISSTPPAIKSPPTKEIGTSTMQHPIIRWLIPLAIAATMAIGSLFFPTEQLTPQELYTSHFDPATISFTTRGDSDEASLANVADLYNDGSYNATIELIESLPEELQSRDKIVYAKGISLIASQRYAEGRVLLDKLPALYGDETLWYKALSYLQEENKPAAITALESISPKFNRYKSVNLLLEQLQ